MRLADLIREERKKRGLSKAELARRAELSPSAITRLENGEVRGRSDSVARIAKVLGIPAGTVQAILSEQAESEEIQFVDLARVPSRMRQTVRRQIEAIVRAAESDAEDGEQR